MADGRAKSWVASLVLVYWVLSTPIAALGLVHWLSPVVHPVLSVADAGGATAIVVLGAGMQVHRVARGFLRRSHARGLASGARSRRDCIGCWAARRSSRPAASGTSPYSESALMAHQLEQLGVPADKIIKEEKSTNTRRSRAVRATVAEDSTASSGSCW